MLNLGVSLKLLGSAYGIALTVMAQLFQASE